MILPATSLSLLSRLRDEGDHAGWQVSWKRFLELYHEPLLAMAAGIYRHHTGHAVPPQAAIEDVVASVVVDFFKRNRFDPERGRLRTYLRVLTNARIVDMLRKERPLNHDSLAAWENSMVETLPAETQEENLSFQHALLATLIEDLREHIPLRQFEIFEMVKLKGMTPDQVALELGVQRGVVDNTIYKVMTRLREIASNPEYLEEYYI
jgi:RNA polymerase sigma-70 factor (ECF subfamily)